jgi:F0F1-type ATP synthase membrane subunit c/vacuolar-type H+-ATPase subunit K
MPAPKRPSIATMQILWGALCASVTFYPMIMVAAGHGAARAPGPDATLVIALTAVAVVVGVMSVVFPRFTYAQGARQRGATLIGEARTITDQGQHGFRDVATSTMTSTFRDAEAAETAAFALYQVNLILGLALAEAVANFGLVLGFLGMGVARTLPFFAAALALQLPRFPTRDKVLTAFEEAVGARFTAARTE